MVAIIDWMLDNGGGDGTYLHFNNEPNTEWYETATGSAFVSGMWSVVCLTPAAFYAFPAASYRVSVHVQAQIGGVWTTVGKYKVGYEIPPGRVSLSVTTSFVTPASESITALRVRGEMLPAEACEEVLAFIKNSLMFRLICSDQRVTQDVVYI